MLILYSVSHKIKAEDHRVSNNDGRLCWEATKLNAVGNILLGARAQPLGVGGLRTPKIWMDHPNFLGEECDYRYITHCSARNWVYHSYFVLYNILDQGIGPPTLKTWLRPWLGDQKQSVRSSSSSFENLCCAYYNNQYYLNIFKKLSSC